MRRSEEGKNKKPSWCFGGLILSHPLALLEPWVLLALADGLLEDPVAPLSPLLSALCMTIYLPSPWATTMPAAVV